MESWREELYHHGISGQKWGVRRWQNKDGSVTPAGAERYYEGHGRGISRWGVHKDEEGNSELKGTESRSSRSDAGASSSSENARANVSAGTGKKNYNPDHERAQAVVDEVRARRSEWLESLKNRSRDYGEEGEEESSSKSSKTRSSSGVSMSDEQFAAALAQILGVSSLNESDKEEKKGDEDELSEEDIEETKSYMVDPVTEKVYKIDPDTGDAYSVNPSTGEVSDTPMKLESSKLESLVEAVKSGAEQFRTALRNVVNSIRTAREKRKAEENSSKESAPNSDSRKEDDAYQKARDSMMSEEAQKNADKAKADKNDEKKEASVNGDPTKKKK